jgi:drug/metabolite transporter (DMT)-like permease
VRRERSCRGGGVISYVLALGAAAVNAAGNVLNRRASREEPDRAEFRLRLIIGLLRRPAWLSAVALMIASFALSATALGTGELATVQIVLVLELPMTLIGSVRFLGGRLGRSEWLAIGVLTLGVGAILALLDPHSEQQSVRIPALSWIVGATASAGAIVVLFLIARLKAVKAARAALLGIAAGVGYGLTAAFTKGMTQEFSSGGVTGVLTSWQSYALAVSGLCSMWLLQNAYHAGTLAAAQPGITLVDPAESTIWGIAVFSEQIRRGPVLWLALLPVAAIGVGAVLLARSPVMQATQDAETSQRGPASTYDDWTKGDLLKRARELGISGRSSMSKAQLIRALRSR